MSELQLATSLLSIAIFATALVVVDAIFRDKKAVGYYFAIIGLLVTAVLAGINLLQNPSLVIPTSQSMMFTKGMVTFGGYSAFFDVLFCVTGLMTVFASRPYLKREYQDFTEYYSIILFSVAGMMTIAHANNLLTLFLGIEIMSICFYILAGFIRTDIKPIEAAFKYFLLGAFATGFLVYGMALIYGATGSIDIPTIAEHIKNGTATPVYLSIGIALILIGLSFKAAAFPFHQWAPDVYHGAPTVVSAFMSTAGKAGALVGFIIIAKALIPHDIINLTGKNTAETMRLIIACISAATMLVGNITALVQKNVKRMLAYSSVAHAGYLLMGIVANSLMGWEGIIFYATAYMFMQVGAFVVISIIERNGGELQDLNDYAGMAKTHPMIAAMMSIFLLSLAGIPPLAGFFGKYYLFIATVKAGFTWLTIVAVISTLISIYFYISLIIQMYFKESDGKTIEIEKSSANITLAIATAGTILVGLFPSFIIDIARNCFAVLAK